MVTETPRAPVDDHPALASERVLEGVVALGKAELRLAISELRAWLQKALVAAGVLWLAASLAQVGILLVCVSPLLFTVWQPPLVLVSILIPCVAAVLLGLLGLSRMRAAFGRHDAAPKSENTVIAATPATFQPGGSTNAE